jgi:hypothetical protein
LQIAESIIYNYNLEIEKYKWDSSSSGQNGKTSSSGCGGEKTLEIVANNHTQLARKKLDKMIEISKKLSKQFPFVRCDLYDCRGKVYFGELTFYPGKGTERFYPRKADMDIGSMLSLSDRL